MYYMDKHDECIYTCEDNAVQIAMDLVMRGHVVTTWTDGDGCKYDILWSYDATRIGRSSMIDAGPGKLFVGIAGKGCYGFTVGGNWIAPSYVREKLGTGGGVTAESLANLLTMVRREVVSHMYPQQDHSVAENAAARVEAAVITDQRAQDEAQRVSYARHLAECGLPHDGGPDTCPQTLTDEPGKITRLT